VKPLLLFASMIVLASIALSIAYAAEDPQFFVYVPLIAKDAHSQPGTPTPVPTQQPVDPAQKRAEVIAAVNAERATAGCALVVEDATLTTAAQAWSDYMVAHNIINHSDTNDVSWYLNHGYTRTDWVYENIAGGPSTGGAAVALWISDEGHKGAILAGCTNTSSIFDIGVGYNNQAWTLAIGELHD
jgi:uncharacterized protein YkwD